MRVRTLGLGLQAVSSAWSTRKQQLPAATCHPAQLPHGLLPALLLTSSSDPRDCAVYQQCLVPDCTRGILDCTMDSYQGLDTFY